MKGNPRSYDPYSYNSYLTTVVLVRFKYPYNTIARIEDYHRHSLTFFLITVMLSLGIKDGFERSRLQNASDMDRERN